MTMQDLILDRASREQMARRLGELTARVGECLYFGCIGGPGHFLFKRVEVDATGRRV